MEPTQCRHPACSRWTYADYCSDECVGFPATTAAKGIGMVTPPHKVRYSQPKRVRRSEGYIARNGAWIATEPAPYLEFARDARMPARKATTPRDTRQNAQSTAKVRLSPGRIGRQEYLASSNCGNPDA